MNEPSSDFEWLQQFVRAGNQNAFGQIVRRHIDLVFATALRKTGDAGSAEEISQNVFAILARKAWQFAPDDSVPGWLFKTTLFESQAWLRGELRRRRREQTAAELGTIMKTSDEKAAFSALVPLLDEALLSLREKDRTALLLRYYEKQSLRAVGGALGVSEDTAQKRVAAALEKLSQFFQRRGYKTATAALTAATLQYTTATASAAITTLVLDTALASSPSALAGWGVWLARLACLSKTQTAAICAAVAVMPLAWKWEQGRSLAKEEGTLRAELAAVQQERASLTGELENLRQASAQLEQRRSEALQEQARREEVQRKLAGLKVQTRAMLAADDYRWPDDLPFVRVPKSALASIKVDGGPESPAKLQAKLDQFLDLSPQEREATARVFTNYFAQIDRLVETSLIETNASANLTLPPDAESRVFVLPALGPKIRTALDQLCAGLEAALGAERWAMVEPDHFEFTHYEQVRLLGYTTYSWDQPQEYAVSVYRDGSAGPRISWRGSDGTGSSPMLLSYLAAGARGNPLLLPQGPPALVDRIEQYARSEAGALISNASAK